MKSSIQHEWNGHAITVSAHASARYLWLDHTFDVRIDDRHVITSSCWNCLSASTRFDIHHQGRKLSGQLIASGFPCTPVVTLATVLDDVIIGHSQLWIKNRWLSYTLLCGVVAFLLSL